MVGDPKETNLQVAGKVQCLSPNVFPKDTINFWLFQCPDTRTSRGNFGFSDFMRYFLIKTKGTAEVKKNFEVDHGVLTL